MKYIFIFAIFSTITIGCDIKTIPIEGDYQRNIFRSVSNKPEEETWSNLLDFLQEKKIAISHSDRSSGLITSSNISFLHNYTFETRRNLQLLDPNAYVVCARLRGPFTLGSSLDMQDVTGQWQFRVKKEDRGSSVEITLTNPVAYSQGMDIGQLSKRGMRHADKEFFVQSTGVFEKEAASALR